jgi:hypothetical protein
MGLREIARDDLVAGERYWCTLDVKVGMEMRVTGSSSGAKHFKLEQPQLRRQNIPPTNPDN